MADPPVKKRKREKTPPVQTSAVPYKNLYNEFDRLQRFLTPNQDFEVLVFLGDVSLQTFDKLNRK